MRLQEGFSRSLIEREYELKFTEGLRFVPYFIKAEEGKSKKVSTQVETLKIRIK